jgi:hypothetical protein
MQGLGPTVLAELIAYKEETIKHILHAIPLLDHTFSLFFKVRRSVRQANLLVYHDIIWFAFLSDS